MKTLFKILLPCLMLMPGIIFAQNTMVTFAGNYTPPPGQQINVPIRVTNFTDIMGVSLSVFYDTAVLTYNGNEVWDTALNNGWYIYNEANPGNFKLVWMTLTTEVTIPDTALLATLNFTYHGGTTLIVFDTVVGGECEIINNLGLIPPHLYINGLVTDSAVIPPCNCSISYSSVAPQGAIFYASNLGASPAFQYSWDFGDGHTQTYAQSAIYHHYDSLGPYLVNLYVRSFNTCVSICSTAIAFDSCFMGGTVTAGQVLDTGKIELYWVDSLTTLYGLVDSLEINDSFCFANVVSTYYLLKVTPGLTSAFYSNYIPTYYPHQPYWETAQLVYPLQMIGPYDIQLVAPLGAPSGPAAIEGAINYLIPPPGLGPAAPGVEILLTTITDSVLAVFYSDNGGNFHFDSLAYGTYKLRAEITGIVANPVTITLSPATPLVTDILLLISPNGITMGIQQDQNMGNVPALRIYPNPANEQISVEVRSNKNENGKLGVYNIMGQPLIEQNLTFDNGIGIIRLDVGSLNPGIYYLSISYIDGRSQKCKFTVCR